MLCETFISAEVEGKPQFSLRSLHHCCYHSYELGLNLEPLFKNYKTLIKCCKLSFYLYSPLTLVVFPLQNTLPADLPIKDWVIRFNQFHMPDRCGRGIHLLTCLQATRFRQLVSFSQVFSLLFCALHHHWYLHPILVCLNLRHDMFSLESMHLNIDFDTWMLQLLQVVIFI